MAKQKIETSIEINGVDVVAYPLVESDHVTFENGMGINEMIKGDVSTPVVTHEEISFKVGKGDSDVSSSIVDSSVGEMIIKGQTYQNILPEPSLRNSMSNGKTMQKFNEGYDNVNVVDGVGKSVILKGQTLTNIHKLVRPILEAETPSNYAITKNSVGEISFDVLVSEHKKWRYINAGFLNISLLKPNTKYLVVFEESQNITWVKFMSGNALNAISESGKVQNNRAIVTTLNQITDNRQILYLTFEDGTPNTKVSSKNPMIIEYQEGMEDWDIPYFEGMKSVESPSLVSVGKNLCNRVRGYHSNTGGTQNSWASFDMSCKPNTTYTAKIFGGSNNRFGFYSGVGVIGDASPYTVTTGNFTQYAGGEKAFTITTGKNDNVMWVYLDNNSIASLDDVVVQVEQGIQATPYEPHKSNTLTTPLDLTLRGIGNVYDTLDFVSGEKVECIGEIVLDGSEEEKWVLPVAQHGDNTYLTYIRLSDAKPQQGKLTVIDKLPYLPVPSGDLWYPVADIETYRINHNRDLLIRWNKTRFSKAINSVSDFKEYLRTNPITVQYQLETPIVKTIDLISSGNWEKVVLDGSQNWSESFSGWANKVFCLNNKHTPNIATQGTTATTLISNDILTTNIAWLCEVKGRTGVATHKWAVDYLQIAIDGIETVDQLKSHLAENPITVWYQTTTHQDSTQVKQLLSFSNGHIQLTSKDGSLIPSLDYEVPTSNSYHLDLAKTSTQYTMKNMSGTFTIDNNNYNASANSAFTTPTSMANKLMITSVVQSNVMLLEGDLTSKTIPYFKGIKSAFEGKDKIEVLSTGRNLVNLDNAILNSNHQKVVTKIENGFNIKFTYNPNNFSGWDNAIRLRVDVKPNTNYVLSLTKIVRKDPYQGITPLPLWVSGYTWVRQGDSHHDSLTEGNLTNGLPTVMKFNSRNFNYVTLDICSTPSRPAQDGDFDIVDIQIEESSTATPYEPYKSNITKIPLLSPLRSLPNGVCDGLIIDRMKKKATLIQRVGDIFVNGSEKWNNMEITTPTNYVLLADNRIKCGNDRHFNNVSSSFPVQSSYDRSKENCYVAYKNQLIFTPFTERFRNLQEFKQWLSQNPTTVYYELETPIITEIDLEGFPYVYKDGHIFLNSEIAPTTTMKYSINQSHQIASQNGDLMRHEKEISYLYTLIAKYVNVQYESTLLNLDLELSRA